MEDRGPRVLDPRACADELVEILDQGSSPTIGFYERHFESQRLPETGPDAWLRADPLWRLARIFAEIRDLVTSPATTMPAVAPALVEAAVHAGVEREFATLIIGSCLELLVETAA